VFETGAVRGAVVAELVTTARAVSSAQATMLTALVRVYDAAPVPEFAAMEISSSLKWTRRAAAAKLHSALAIIRRIPALGRAMAAGDLDLPRAEVIADQLSTLDDLTARRLADRALPLAAKLTTGELRARLAKMVIAADPETAAKRHTKRSAERRVVFEPEQDGCANLLGLDIPADEALRASRNITKHARALKRAGDPRSMDQLRADTFIRLLCGESVGKGSVELTVSLPVLAELSRNPGLLAGYGPIVAEIARKVAAQQADSSWTYTARDPETGEAFHGPLRSRPRATFPAGPASAAPASPTRTTMASQSSNAVGGKEEARLPSPRPSSSGSAAPKEMVRPLSSGLGSSGSASSTTSFPDTKSPASGPTKASPAHGSRAPSHSVRGHGLVRNGSANGGSTPESNSAQGGHGRARAPDDLPQRRSTRTGGAPSQDDVGAGADFASRASMPAPGDGPAMPSGDLDRPYTEIGSLTAGKPQSENAVGEAVDENEVPGLGKITDGEGARWSESWEKEARKGEARDRERPDGEARESEARKAAADVRREVIARDRTCRAPGCRVPASACDLDHTVNWASGGRTLSANLVPLCRYHHRAKHEGGWNYWRQPDGSIVWRSPLGNLYRTDPQADDDDLIE
jgi:hypothetical protein